MEYGEHMWSTRLSSKACLCAAIASLSCVVGLLEAQVAARKPADAAATGTGAPPETQSLAPAVQPAAPDAELPGAIYKEAMRPLAVVRQSMENWSDSELAALSIGIQLAHESCEKMNADDYSGDDLYDLAHLCAFGQDWNPANTAAQHYLRDRAARYRAQSLAISIGAYVHINAPDLALATTRIMLRAEPYDAEVAYTVHYMKDYLETAGSPDALELAIEEHQKIIDALSSGTPLKASYGDTTVNIGVLYQMAMEAAFFARYAGNETQAAGFAADVEHALPKDAALTAEDRQTIDSSNLQYRLLGSKLTPIAAIHSYKSTTVTKPQIDTNSDAATVLVIFPDWCVQCRKMMPAMTKFGVQHADPIIRAYGLIFREPGEELALDTQKELLGTNVVEVSAETAHSFGMSDYPLGLIVDHAGVIRFIGELPSAAFNGGYMEKLIGKTAGVNFKTPENPPKAK